MDRLIVYLAIAAFFVENSLNLGVQGAFGLKMGTTLNNFVIYLFVIGYIFSVKNRGCLWEKNSVNRYLFLLIVFMCFELTIGLLGYAGEKREFVKDVVILKNGLNPWLYFILIFQIIQSTDSVKKIISGLNILMVLTVFAAFGETVLGIDLGTRLGGKVFDGRFAGFAEPNQYAVFLVLIIPTSLSMVAFNSGFGKKSLGLIISFFGMIGLIATGSRGGFIAFIFSVGVLFWIGARNELITKGKILVYILLCLCMGALTYAVSPGKIKEIVGKRLDPIGTREFNPWRQERSLAWEYTSGRTEIWAHCLTLFFEKPLLGHGTGADISRLRVSTHNDYIKWLLNHGIIGLALFCTGFIQIFRSVKSYFVRTEDVESRILYLSYLSGFSGYMLGMFSVNLHAPAYIFWIYTASILKYGELLGKKLGKDEELAKVNTLYGVSFQPALVGSEKHL